MVMRRMLLLSLVLILAGTGCARQNRNLGNITRRSLASTELIQGVPCASFAVFFENGNLLTCDLSREADIGAARLPAGTTVRFHADGGLWYAFLPRPTEINGCLCKGCGSKGTMTAFYPTGELRECWPARDETVQGIPCTKATTRKEIFGRLAGRGSPVAVFYKSGNLHSCMLSEDFELNGALHKKGTRITLQDAPGSGADHSGVQRP
jgi:hypothetical protein